jgi:hypothetical protein
VGATVSQGGLLHTTTDPAKVTEFIYDAMGRTAGSRVGTEDWSCIVRDGRGRVTFNTVAGPPSRTVSYNFAVSSNPLVTSVGDPNGTITTTTDLYRRRPSANGRQH